MKNPLDVINKIQISLDDVITENNIKYLGGNVNQLLQYYCADLCSMMLEFYPGATIMMNKNFRTCAVMIQGNVYNIRGLVDRSNYFIAGEEEVGFIRKSFPQLPDAIMEKLIEKVFIEQPDVSLAFSLRKNVENL